MGLSRYKLGELIEQRREKNDSKEDLIIRGISKEGFIKPKQIDADTSIYNVFYKKDFVFNPARMELNSIALNLNFEKAICSSLYEVFYVTRTDVLLPEYLNLIIKRDEFARKCWFDAIGSARNYFRVANLSEFYVTLPPLAIQQKYVDVYNAMVANQKAYERGLEDLKLACDGTIENIKAKHPKEKIMSYIKREDNRNSDNMIKNVKGVSTSKEFREPTSKVNRDKLSNYKIVKPKEISFVQTTHNEKVFAYAFNNTDKDIVVTSVNEVFSTSKDLLPEYLVMFFNRKEFDRYARFHSWGSARETFTWEDLENVEIPIISIKLQKYISDIYKVYTERKEINEKLKEQIKSICPVLIKGAMEEADREGV